jgi:hypothetical protein
MYPIIGLKNESIKKIIINPVEIYVNLTIIALKVDELADTLIKLTINAARL